MTKKREEKTAEKEEICPSRINTLINVYRNQLKIVVGTRAPLNGPICTFKFGSSFLIKMASSDKMHELSHFRMMENDFMMVSSAKHPLQR